MTSPTQENLEAQLAKSAVVTFGFDGTIRLTNAIVINSDSTLDAAGRDVILDGQNSVRHFVVNSNVTLRLINLKLINGRYEAMAGQTNRTGEIGRGGSIHNKGGRLELIHCELRNSQAIGGKGGIPAEEIVDESTGLINIGFATHGGAAYGGAIYSAGGTVSLTDCTLAENNCRGGEGTQGNDGYGGGGGDSHGGSLYCTNSQTTLLRVLFTNNLAVGGEISPGRARGTGGAASGGGLKVDGGQATIDLCAFESNQAIVLTRATRQTLTSTAYGGAIYLAAGNLLVRSSLFKSNVALGGRGYERDAPILAGDANGGAIFSRGTLELRNSALVLNKAQGGIVVGPLPAVGGTASGGAICDEGRLTVNNCTFAGNVALGGGSVTSFGVVGSAYGGGVFSSGQPSFLNVTFADNAASLSSGSTSLTPYPQTLGGSIMLTNTSARLANTILQCAASQTNVAGAVLDGGHNLSTDSSVPFNAAGSVSNVDPQLMPLGDYGGPTPSMPPKPSSPAIDTGDSSLNPADDQRGVARIQGLGSDIGAVEVVPSLALSFSNEGLVRLNYSFRSAQSNRVELSSDLLNWSVLATIKTDETGKLQFEHSRSSQPPQEFYRVRPSDLY